ncbi:hypothetical protein ASF30_01055 [Leifsonia sp. Leaf264]|nr:hypothetical protein ASF30_01055 [Leifsonia sp. Leaf264]
MIELKNTDVRDTAIDTARGKTPGDQSPRLVAPSIARTPDVLHMSFTMVEVMLMLAFSTIRMEAVSGLRRGVELRGRLDC